MVEVEVNSAIAGEESLSAIRSETGYSVRPRWGEKMPRTLAAIAAYNEEVAIGSVVLRCQRQVDEVLVVDDGSEDRTAEIAKLAGAVVQRIPTNAGKGTAIQTALAYARANGFDAVVLLDGDGQHDPGDIPQLLELVIANKADLAIGVRRRSTSRMPVYRRFGQRVLDFLTAFGSMDALTDSQSGFRALSRTAIDSLQLEERSFGIESEMLIDARMKNLRVAEVPIAARYDVDGSTIGPLSHGFGLVDRLLRIIAVRHPLLFFGSAGVGLLVVGLILGLVALPAWPRFPELAFGYSFLVVITLTVGVLGILAGIILNVLPKAIAHALGDGVATGRHDTNTGIGKPTNRLGLRNRLVEALAVRHALLFFGLLGTALLVAGVLLGLNALGLYPKNPELAIGYSFIVVISVVIGVLALNTAIMLNVLPKAIARTLHNRGT